MADIIGATTGVVNAVGGAAQSAASIVDSGPASALGSGISGVSDVLGGISSFLGSFGGNPGGVTKLPIPNPLSGYASYDYLITLSAMSWTDHNFPDSSYKAGKTLPIICSSAGRNPSNRVQTQFGKFEFYIDNLRFESAIGLSNAKSTNVTTVQFDIFEPYSLGLFPLALQTAAKKVGLNNWREAYFLLTIEFRGNKENGSMTTVPNTTRHIPIKLTTMTFKATEQGSSYGINAYATNSQALTVQYASLKTDMTIKGKTVQEVLQTGEQSLQAILNRKEKEYVKNGQKKVADEYVILFPNNIASSDSLSTAPNTVTSPTVNPSLQTGAASVYKKIGVIESTINSTYVQQDGQVNALGTASMGYDLTKIGDPTTKSEVKTLKNGVFVRGDITADIKEGSLRFAQNVDIPTVINTVLMLSEYPKTALDSNNEKDGFKTWWRIDTQVYCIDTKENEKSTNTIPKIIVYRVVPYLAHSSAQLSANQVPKGYDKMKKQVVKNYDYIFTGKNTEIIRFNIDYSISFSNILAADFGKNSGDVVSAKSSSGDEEKEPDVNQGPPGNANSSQEGVGNTSVKYSGTESKYDRKGGGGRDTQITRAAKIWHDAITNPLDMLNLDMEIHGDPFWIVNSGLGNYTSKQAPISKDLNSDGSVNWQSSEVEIYVNFKNPLDINQATGLYDFKSFGYGGGAGSQSDGAIGFKGLYRVNIVTSHFRNGEFRQTLQGFRRKLQESDATPTVGGVSSNIPSILSNIAGQVSSAVSSIGSSVSSAISSVTSTVTSNISSAVGNTDASNITPPNP